LCLKKPNKMIERSESSLNNPENNCHSQNNQKNQLHFFWKSTNLTMRVLFSALSLFMFFSPFHNEHYA
ncbi:MAG: hypothetical protein WA081_17245, partial [Desulfosalsimonadaceae bacterium]